MPIFDKFSFDDPVKSSVCKAREPKQRAHGNFVHHRKPLLIVLPDPANSLFPVRLHIERLSPEEVRPFENCVPLYDLKAAASDFSNERQVKELYNELSKEYISENEWVELPDAFRPRRGLFVTQVVGESMNRRIPNRAWCLFKLDPGGTRQGKVVLARHREISDTDTGGHYTVKIYESVKEILPDGTWRHASIILRPDTTASGYEPIILSKEQSDDLKVIAELVAVLS